MPWDFQTDRPIYLQIMEHFEAGIVAGEYPAGSRLASVRDLAAEAAVNPNTMQKALAELERRGLLYSNRTSGRYITEDDTVIRQLRNELAEKKIRHFLSEMLQIGFEKDELIELIQERNLP
ncbi:MAG: GntR family transcriptional regulator [Clostridiales bacterium]|nr:GntR family transcriptional regulator [Clostridiales bacterium]